MRMFFVERRAEETYENFKKKKEEFCSQGATPSDEQETEMWKDVVGDPVRGTIYGLPGKKFNEKDPSLYCAPSFGVDSATTSLLEERIAALTRELATKDEEMKNKMVAKDEKMKKMREENDAKFQQVQNQLNMIFQCGAVIPPCPSDRRRRQSSPEDAYTTDEEGGEDEEVPPLCSSGRRRRQSSADDVYTTDEEAELGEEDEEVPTSMRRL